MESGGKPYKYLSRRLVLHHPGMAASVFLAEHHQQSLSSTSSTSSSSSSSYITLEWRHPSSQLSLPLSLSLSLPELKRSLVMAEQVFPRYFVRVKFPRYSMKFPPRYARTAPSSTTGSSFLSFPSFFQHSVFLFQQLLCPTGAAAKSHRGKAAQYV